MWFCGIIDARSVDFVAQLVCVRLVVILVAWFHNLMCRWMLVSNFWVERHIRCLVRSLRLFSVGFSAGFDECANGSARHTALRQIVYGAQFVLSGDGTEILFTDPQYFNIKFVHSVVFAFDAVMQSKQITNGVLPVGNVKPIGEGKFGAEFDFVKSDNTRNRVTFVEELRMAFGFDVPIVQGTAVNFGNVQNFPDICSFSRGFTSVRGTKCCGESRETGPSENDFDAHGTVVVFAQA